MATQNCFIRIPQDPEKESWIFFRKPTHLHYRDYRYVPKVTYLENAGAYWAVIRWNVDGGGDYHFVVYAETVFFGRHEALMARLEKHQHSLGLRYDIRFLNIIWPKDEIQLFRCGTCKGEGKITEYDGDELYYVDKRVTRCHVCLGGGNRERGTDADYGIKDDDLVEQREKPDPKCEEALKAYDNFLLSQNE
jgi:hypothetical protein